MILLGLGGKPRSGKTVAAECLRRVYGARIYSYSELICEELGVTRESVKDASILQDHGDLRRREDPEYWNKRIFAAIANEQPSLAVIPNIRTHTEIPIVRELGGHLIRYVRLNPDGSHHISHDRDMNNPLETSLDLFNWDFYVTAKCGQEGLVELQTIALVRYLESKETDRLEIKNDFVSAER